MRGGRKGRQRGKGRGKREKGIRVRERLSRDCLREAVTLRPGQTASKPLQKQKSNLYQQISEFGQLPYLTARYKGGQKVFRYMGVEVCWPFLERQRS